jgi:hypothetical protein
MRPLISILLCAAPLLALSNHVTITSQAGSGALSVHKVGRAFPDDEVNGIPNCAQPYVGEEAVNAYQCNVKTRYASGRVRFAILVWEYAIADGATATFDFRNTQACNDTGGLSQSEMLAYNIGAGAGAWTAQLKAAASPQGASTQATADARTMLSAGHWSYWLQGPILTEVIVEAPNTQDDLFTYDFGWQNQRFTATTVSTSTTATSVTVFNSAEIAALVATNGTTVVKIDNEQMLACSVVGNVVNIGTADACPGSAGRGYNGTTATGHVSKSTVSLLSIPADQWVDDVTGVYSSLHPYFVLDFWNRNGNPYPGVGVTAVVENAWSGKLQKLAYDVELWAGATAAKVYPSSGTKTVNHPAGSIWSKTVWSGTAHPFEYIDHNLEWLIYTKVVPYYDTARPYVPTARYTAFAAGDKGDIADSSGYLGHGLMIKNFDDNEEGANLQTDEWLFLYNMGASCATAGSNCAKVNDILWGSSVEGGGGMAEVGMHVPYHVRDSGYSTKAYYQAGGSTLAFGKWYSRDAHQTQLATLGANSYLTSAVGQIDTQGWVSTASPAISHMQEHAFLPYVLTGDPRFLRELYYYGHLSSFPASAPSMAAYRWAFIRFSGYGNMRGEAWLYQQLGYAWWAAPDSSDEQSYFRARLDDHTTILEGMFGITDGTFSPADATCAGYAESTTTDRWCFGNRSAMTLTVPTGANSLRLVAQNLAPDTTYFNAAAVSHEDYYIHTAYFTAASARVYDLGYEPAQPLPLWFGGYYMAATVHPDYNPFLTRFLRAPAVRSDGSWINTMADLKAGWNSNYQAISAITDPLYTSRYYPCDSHAYQYQHRSIVALLANESLTLPAAAGGTFTSNGADAWAWLSDPSHLGPVCTSYNPTYDANGSPQVPIRWDHVPRKGISGIASAVAGDTATISYTAPDTTACSVGVAEESSSQFQNSDSANDTQASGGQRFQAVQFTGLNAGAYTFRITCNLAREFGSFFVPPAEVPEILNGRTGVIGRTAVK